MLLSCCIVRVMYVVFFFFFQAEDGIRDVAVTGVQTCALPILGYLVAGLMIFFFGLHGSEIAQGIEAAAPYMPVSSFTAALFSGMSKEGFMITADIFWWGHALILLCFLTYLPYSKHMHILTAIPNCFFRSLEKVTNQQREEFKKGNTFGAEQRS